MEAKAIARYVRIAPRKVNLVAAEVRGKSIDEALAILKFTPKRGAKELENVLKSAVLIGSTLQSIFIFCIIS